MPAAHVPRVEIYCSAACPYCTRALRLLDSKGVAYTKLRVDRVPSLREEMEERSGRTMVPQVFIDDLHVGGFDDLSLLDLEGELDRLLGTEE